MEGLNTRTKTLAFIEYNKTAKNEDKYDIKFVAFEIYADIDC